MFFHLESLIMQQLGRPLTMDETEKLEKYCGMRPERKPPGAETNQKPGTKKEAV